MVWLNLISASRSLLYISAVDHSVWISCAYLSCPPDCWSPSTPSTIYMHRLPASTNCFSTNARIFQNIYMSFDNKIDLFSKVLFTFLLKLSNEALSVCVIVYNTIKSTVSPTAITRERICSLIGMKGYVSVSFNYHFLLISELIKHDVL